MPRVPHPNPQLAQRGVMIDVEPPTRDGPPQSPRTSPRSALIDELPDTFVAQCQFRSIPIISPANLDLSLPSWRPLMSLTVGRDIRQDLALDEIEYELGSPDVSGLFADELPELALPWGGDPFGNATGLGACIVVGENLPIDLLNPKLFVSAPFNYGAWSTDGVSDATKPTLGVLDIAPFPPGKWTDAAPYKERWRVPFGKKQRRLTIGSRIDVALVVMPDVIPAAMTGGNALKGWASVKLKFATTMNPVEFRR